MYKVGDYVDFKLKAGRGRPQLGLILQNKGIGFLVKNPVTRKEIFVPKGKVLRTRTPWWEARKADSEAA